MNDEKELQEISTWYDKNFKLYEKCSKEISEIITKILDKKKIPYHSITFRVKEKSSYLEKCKKDKYKNPIEEIMDLAGIRIITYTNKDIQAICEVVKNELFIDEKNSEDKSQSMVENQVGYLSVHYIVTLREERTKLAEYEDYAGIRNEIQIRTLLQHAWAEIEHDRNYKFSGVLPTEIRRRFYLIAGVLEMMDREFDSLAEDIGKYSDRTKDKMKRKDYKVGIDSVSLEKYMLYKFQDKGIERCKNKEVINNDVVEELIKFGFHTIEDIDDMFTEEMINKLQIDKVRMSYIGILRDAMMIQDIDKYFKEAYQHTCQTMNIHKVELFDKCKVDIRKYLQAYNIDIYKNEPINQ